MSFIRRIFSLFWRLITWLRVGLANLIFILLIIIVIAALYPEEERQMPTSIALRVAPSGFLVDQYSYIDPLTQIMRPAEDQQVETRVRDLVEAINSAASDQRITALVLELGELYGGGLSKLQEVGTALAAFKRSGKPVYALSDSYTQDQYYLASFADEIIMHPMGAMILTGYGSYRHYYKQALDKLALNMHVFRAGEYKDAVEPYLRNTMSEASREHNSRWLGELWSSYTANIEQQRSLEAGSIDDYINRMDTHLAAHQGDSAAAAQAAGIVDTLATHPQQQQLLVTRLGRDKKHDGYRALDYRHYLAFVQRDKLLNPVPDQIGLLVARGMILDGEQPQGSIGSETLAQLIREARDDDAIKAVVVRIDSGGGSAFASEVIRQELAATRASGKPILVSMGSVAASGGYWIAMGADEVWATPSTITGSIGVFSAFPTLDTSLDKLGIHSDGVGTTELAGALRIDRPLSPLVANLLQQSVDSIYQRFLNLVAQARDSTPEQIDRIGQGRVWTGSSAKQLGLVDELGQLEDVIAAAADRAGLDSYEVVEVHKPLTPAEQIIKRLSGKLLQVRTHLAAPGSQLELLLGLASQQLQPLLQLLNSNDPRSVYAHCLDCVTP
ncbi:MAG: signal peptide peptidase SppA [Gammaproteobacteria bacterium]|uniref:signal peptide peptidase SppA n=1 Tax=Pseudomaricurvus alcaniphilus TaxID=1166482 RepID=UPI00140E27E9|nr:signal peptide peptidase SppA [Pseudomaricurvus alcaniphilus]MBR9908887.1 signal peptide peptidase SppA [Gammaproteobacteria bacterium]NHN37940.1 signal peptide peptidase SppA [Pseudomaricurvus alcaniphilus]